ncbi:MAG: CpsD/CapB family tyrosine-protein kinase [Candidatus Omnitrophota bacterium]
MNFKKIATGLKDIVGKYVFPTAYVAEKEKRKDGIDGRIVSIVDKESYQAEQYKVLRTNLYSMSPEAPIRTVALTSSQEQEGKTITSCNLAASISLDAGKKVILIDADLRRPAVHRMFGIQRDPGFAHVISGDVDIEHFTKTPSVENIYIIPAGTPEGNPSEMLMSEKMKHIIGELKQNFDYILFDTPPVMSVTDASILGAMCDAVFFVVKSGVTQASLAEEAYNMLVGAQARPKAAILTNVSDILDLRYYRYKYKQYHRDTR